MPPEAPAAASLRIKLVWLTFFRTVATVLLLGVVAARMWSRPPDAFGPQDSATFAVIAVVFLLNLVYGLWLRQRRVDARAAYVQVIGDVMLATSLVYLTGGGDSPFTFTYSLAIIAGAILLFERGATVAAVCSAVAFVSLLFLIQAGLVRPLGTGALPAARLLFVVSSNVLAQSLIAVLANYLARQLSLAGRQLQTREADLLQLERLQQQIVSSMPSGLITCTPEGRVTFINRAGAAILGLDDAAWPKDLEAVIPGALHLPPNSRRNELRVSRAGREVIVGITSARLEGAGAGFLMVFQDLTELRRTEERLRRTDRLAELGTLAAQLAHEIRNPLAAMRGAAQMIAADHPPDGTTGRLTGILLRETDRLAALVTDFLQFARPAAPALRAVSLAGLVGDTLDMLKVDPLAARARIEVETEEVRAWIDPDQLRQVLLNLLRNALVAAGEGGRVKVSAREENRNAVLRVWDSGGSIPKEHLKRVFDPFFTTRAGGTGLGLSTAHSIVAAHRGTIDVRSSPEEGTEFVVTLEQPAEGRDADPGR